MIEEVRKIVKEELGISNEVIGLTKRFYDEMLVFVNESNEIEKKETVIIKRTSMKFQFNGITINCNIIYRNFLSKDYVKLYEMPYVTNGGSFRLTDKLYFCFINFYAISGTIVKEKAMETIQHEIEHVYQQVRMGKGFGKDELYAKVKSDMESGDDNRSKIGKLVYYCFKSEQEGFVNGLYAYMMDSEQPYTDDLLRSSETWEIYVFMKNVLSELKDKQELKEVFSEYTNEYGLSYYDIDRETENFLHRIGRVIVKVKEDKTKQGWR